VTRRYEAGKNISGASLTENVAVSWMTSSDLIPSIAEFGRHLKQID
jgi:hypothetical protein